MFSWYDRGLTGDGPLMTAWKLLCTLACLAGFVILGGLLVAELF
jgi:hypothetical protein